MTGDEVTLTYREVAAMVGGPLPTTAVFGASWWTGTRLAHVQAWRAHGSPSKLRVRFIRAAESEP